MTSRVYWLLVWHLIVMVVRVVLMMHRARWHIVEGFKWIRVGAYKVGIAYYRAKKRLKDAVRARSVR